MASKDSKARKPTSHPPYAEMIKEAIATLKERSGSIPYAIGKYIEDKQKGHLPSNFRKFLSVQLKKLTAEGKLTKVKNSYKLSTPEKANPKVKPAATDTKSKSKSKAKTKPAGVGVKPKPKAAAKPKPKTTPKRTGKAAKKDALVKVEEKRESQSNPKTKTVAASAKIAKTTRMDTPRK